MCFPAHVFFVPLIQTLAPSEGQRMGVSVGVRMLIDHVQKSCWCGESLSVGVFFFFLPFFFFFVFFFPPEESIMLDLENQILRNICYEVILADLI